MIWIFGDSYSTSFNHISVINDWGRDYIDFKGYFVKNIILNLKKVFQIYDIAEMIVVYMEEFNINENIVNEIMLLNGIEDTWKILLMMGIGVFITSFKDYNNPSNWREIEGVHFLNNPLTLTCSRSYQHGSGFNYIQILEKQFGELEYLRMGSALKFFELAKGNADLYPRFAPTMEWDIASGHAILKALGGDIVSVSNNKSLEYNKKSLFNEPFIAKSRAFLKI